MTYEELFLEGYYDALNEMEDTYDEYEEDAYESYNEEDLEEAYLEGYYTALEELDVVDNDLGERAMKKTRNIGIAGTAVHGSIATAGGVTMSKKLKEYKALKAKKKKTKEDIARMNTLKKQLIAAGIITGVASVQTVGASVTAGMGECGRRKFKNIRKSGGAGIIVDKNTAKAFRDLDGHRK